jgi:hypothetical protein
MPTFRHKLDLFVIFHDCDLFVDLCAFDQRFSHDTISFTRPMGNAASYGPTVLQQAVDPVQKNYPRDHNELRPNCWTLQAREEQPQGEARSAHG